ncbi:MAG: Txe/YoeB family addiction module toxin [Proteobacteria bacterium]|nr:Txe/YoeB family addiction module toxin [Pseudomonadota bacterium]
MGYSNSTAPSAAPEEAFRRPRVGSSPTKRINLLINAAARDPFAGIGKPEPLRGDLSGYWSRHIDDVNRLIYRANDRELVLIACRFHYN